MKELEKLLDRIIQRININLRELDYDVTPFIKNLVPLNQMVKFYAFYGITPHHPLDFRIQTFQSGRQLFFRENPNKQLDTLQKRYPGRRTQTPG